MDVAAYIREYLYKQDFLDIPGLGTFFLSREPFSMEGQKQSIKPGSKTLIFRENSVVNNDTFAYFIARRASISVDEAKLMVRDFVGRIRELFLTRGSIEISGLGKFSAPDGFHLQFTSGSHNFSPNSFGLGSLNLSSFAPASPQAEFDVTTSRPPNPVVFESPAVDDPAVESPVSAPQADPVSSLAPQDGTVSDKLSGSGPVAGTIASAGVSPSGEPGALPTAEELYRMYGFRKDAPEEPVSSQIASNELFSKGGVSQTEHTEQLHPDLASENEFAATPTAPKTEEQIITSSPALDWTYTLAEEDSKKQLADSEGHLPAQPVSESSAPVEPEEQHANADLVYNPLAWTPETPLPDSNQTGYNDAAGHPHLETEELAARSQTMLPKPEPVQPNNSLYWIMGSLLLLAMIGFFVYLQRDSLLKQWKTSQGMARLNQDSHLSAGDSTRALNRKLETKAPPAVPADTVSAHGLIKVDTSGAIPDTVSSKPITEAARFLITESAFHLKKTAQVRARQLAGKKLSSEIIVGKAGDLFRFKVVLGEFDDRAAAHTALDTLKSKGQHGLIQENKNAKSKP